MPELCPHCGEKLPFVQDAFCPECRKLLFDGLQKLERFQLYPTHLRTQAALAESELVNWLVHPRELPVPQYRFSTDQYSLDSIRPGEMHQRIDHRHVAIKIRKRNVFPVHDHDVGGFACLEHANARSVRRRERAVFGGHLQHLRRGRHIGIIHDEDRRLAAPLIAALKRLVDVNVGINEPYSPADRVYFTLERHARSRGLACAMIEIRNDEISGDAGQRKWADLLTGIFSNLEP